LRPAYHEVKENIRESDAIYVDETAFPVGGDRHWVWTFVTDDAVLYKFDESRGSKVLEAVLGEEFAEDATLSCDGWSAYPTYHTKLQRCWAHLLREAEFLAERYREAKPLCDELHELHDDLTTFDEENPSASAREQKRADAMLHLEGLTRQEYESEEVQKLITKIRNGLGHWLTFVTEPDVDSTNNRAERALREQVMLRKMFRTLQPAEGVYIHETITTMLATWKLRGLDPPEQLQSALGGRDLSSP
jgi:transposase